MVVIEPQALGFDWLDLGSAGFVVDLDVDSLPDKSGGSRIIKIAAVATQDEFAFQSTERLKQCCVGVIMHFARVGVINDAGVVQIR